MSECPNKTTCPLFPYFKSTAMVRFWKDQYCNSDYNSCARFQQSSCGVPVPLTLLPSGGTLRRDPGAG